MLQRSLFAAAFDLYVYCVPDLFIFIPTSAHVRLLGSFRSGSLGGEVFRRQYEQQRIHLNVVRTVLRFNSIGRFR